MDYYMSDNSEYQFESISDFMWCMKCGGEVEFEWNGKSYGIVHDPGDIVVFYEAKNAASEQYFKSSDELLDMMLGDDKFRDIVTKINVIARTI